jgi:hypothetical protein
LRYDLRWFSQISTSRCDRAHLDKYWLFYLLLEVFTAASLLAPSASNFRLEGVELLFRLLCCGAKHFSCAGIFRHLYSFCVTPTTQLLNSTKSAIGIGSCQDLSDCNLSYKKWKLFFHICQERGKLCQFSLTIPAVALRAKIAIASRPTVDCKYRRCILRIFG